MNADLRALAATQSDLVAAWQLREAGWTTDAIRHQLEGGWRVIHRGVYALTQAPLTRRQEWIAATLTSPNTILSHASAADCWGFRPFRGTYETVTRPGSGGPKRFGGVLVLRSSTLAGNTEVRDGVAITTPERTIIDLAPLFDDRVIARMLREAIRMKLTTAKRLDAVLDSHPTCRRVRLLRDLTSRYGKLPIRRTRVDSEALAVAHLQEAGIQIPRVNARTNREEADLTWDGLIVEIDGPQFHRFPDEDARKQRAWEAAGYVVRRVSSDVIYDQPALFIALVRRWLEEVRVVRERAVA